MNIEQNDILDDVLPEDYLKLSNEILIKNLSDLIHALDKMSKDDFALHVYGNNNDFAEWILESYWDDSLTGKVLRIKNKAKLSSFLKKVLEKAKKKSSMRIESPKRKKNVLKILRDVEI